MIKFYSVDIGSWDVIINLSGSNCFLIKNCKSNLFYVLAILEMNNNYLYSKKLKESFCFHYSQEEALLL